MINPYYSQLLEEVTDEVKSGILHALLTAAESADPSVTRGELIRRVYGVDVTPETLAGSREDRRIRAAIAELRRSWPIVSSSGGAGYRLEVDVEAIMAFRREQLARAEKLRQSAHQAVGWLTRARAIREYLRSGVEAVQSRLL